MSSSLARWRSLRSSELARSAGASLESSAFGAPICIARSKLLGSGVGARPSACGASLEDY